MLDMKTGWQKICDGNPENINVIGDYVYFTDLNTLYRVSTNGKDKAIICDEKVRNVIVTSTGIFYVNCFDSKIYKMNLSTNKKVQISNDLCNVFSLEKDWIYYSSFRFENGNDIPYENDEIYKIKLDGSNKTKIITTESIRPIVYKGWVYYQSMLQYSKLYREKNDGSTIEKLDDSQVRYFNFSGNYIVFSDFNNTLKKVNLDNIKDTFTLDLIKNNIFRHTAILSIDNYLLLFNDRTEIYKLNANGIGEQISQ